MNALKLTNYIHNSIFGKERSIEIPELLSENIVRNLLELECYDGETVDSKGKSKKYDAQKKDEKSGKIEYYEIKATSSKKGTTTINLTNKPDYLIWTFFNFENSIIEIRIFEKFNDSQKTDLSHYLNNKSIPKIKREKIDGKPHQGTDKFEEVFAPDSNSKTTVNLDNFLWNELILCNMNTLTIIK